MNMYRHINIFSQTLIFYRVTFSDLDPPDINFNHQGYLLMASDKYGEEVLKRNNETQM